MLEEIIDLAGRSDYDFRLSACSDDPLRHLFDEWVPYYRGKWAIARYLQPARILEIGVRYGYSALAFLNACPSARYLGIDLDSDLYGGAKGAIEWARSHTRDYKAEFIIADSQTFERFPGGDYDLIHVDGQQDDKGFLHDMEIALRQARYILVDGYFWTRDNFLSASEFLYCNKDLIRFYGVIPGYAGDLLIARKENTTSSPVRAPSSSHIRDAYTNRYYLCDCGGFDSFKRTQGVKLQDPRLQTVARIASLARAGRALDLGCGRGELSIALAKLGFAVTGIDYSPDAIALAESAKSATGDPSLKVQFVCDDLIRAPLDGSYDAVVAADVVEHLAPAELDELYQRIAAQLADDGLFVIHTFPNSWYYRYEHARKLRIARSVGAYLPLNPRSHYERLMHINEQSPRVLRRQLRQYFPHVLVWFSEHSVSNPFENLQRRFSIREMAQSGDLFAIAAKRPVPRCALLREFRMEPCFEVSKGDLAIEVLRAPSAVRASSTFTVDLMLRNGSSASLKSFPPNPVHLAYHWLEAASSQIVVFDGERTPLDPHLSGQSEQRYQMFVRSPAKKTGYRLRATLVQEFVQWLDDPPAEVFADISIDVV
ncbi:MAG: methyltransferase domain-containing protein [Bryobacteraceae bacterium]